MLSALRLSHFELLQHQWIYCTSIDTVLLIINAYPQGGEYGILIDHVVIWFTAIILKMGCQSKTQDVLFRGVKKYHYVIERKFS